MKKVTTLVLMLGLILSGALCYASGVTRTEVKVDETPSITILKTKCGGTDKSGSISASIDGHYLTIVFTENLGQVAVEVTTSTGNPVDTLEGATPTGMLIFIALPGDYIVNFTLPNGDEYYGEFTVTD